VQTDSPRHPTANTPSTQALVQSHVLRHPSAKMSSTTVVEQNHVSRPLIPKSPSTKARVLQPAPKPPAPTPPAPKPPTPLQTPERAPCWTTARDESTCSGMVNICMADVTELAIEEMWMEIPSFDPMHPPLRSRLLQRLGFGQDAIIEPSMDNSGAFNDGVWHLYDRNTFGLTLKLVDSSRRHPARPTDTEKFVEIAKACPTIMSEFSVAFPVMILILIPELPSQSDISNKDLIVMRRAGGVQLTRTIYDKFHNNELAELSRIFGEFGAFMAKMHRVYKGRQHGDCQPSNVFYDRLVDSFTLIDAADFGYGPFMTEWGGDDVENFVRGLKTLTQWYGPNVIADVEANFRAGYVIAAHRGARDAPYCRHFLGVCANFPPLGYA